MSTKIVLPEKDCKKVPCNCCGEAIYNSGGVIVQPEGVIADYWSRWSPAHKGMFSLAITLDSRTPNNQPTVYCLSGRTTSEGVTYSVLNPEDTTWWNFEGICDQLSREEALNSNNIDNVFELAEIITDNDCRITLNIFEMLNLEYPKWVESMCDIYLCAYEIGVSFPAKEPAIFPLENLSELSAVLLNEGDNFFGINDDSEMSLQFYRNQDGTITIDIPMHSEAGSYQKNTDLAEVEDILKGFSGNVLPVISERKLSLTKW